MGVETEIIVTAPVWETIQGLDALTRTVVDQCGETCGVEIADGCELSVNFTDDATICELNSRWRGVDKPTNVLSFETPGDPSEKPILGDVVIAYETVDREAREQNKTFEAHLSHLIAHGFLHLLGYDHQAPEQADAMEALERHIMAGLGLPDPYEGTLPIESTPTHGNTDANV